MSATFIGIMSGTSVDAIDAAAVSFPDGQVKIHAVQSNPIDGTLRQRITNIMQGVHDDLDSVAALDRDLGHAFSECATALMAKLDTPPLAIGCHGQTVRHRPEQRFTVQLGAGAIIATHTGIPTITDFRSSDIALGGQGAPLVPAFHKYIFGSDKEDRVIVNIGGIANITLLPKTAGVSGFDTGPGNSLMDSWYRKHHQGPWDTGGAWSRTGAADEALLTRLSSDAFFEQRPPKSTGLEYFNSAWLSKWLSGNERPADVQATLRELTTTSIQDAVTKALPAAKTLYLCGGGAQNGALKASIQSRLPDVKVESTAALSIDPMWVEACAFAWLARQRWERKPGSLPSVTGASRTAVLGSLYLP